MGGRGCGGPGARPASSSTRIPVSGGGEDVMVLLLCYGSCEYEMLLIVACTGRQAENLEGQQPRLL